MRKFLLALCLLVIPAIFLSAGVHAQPFDPLASSCFDENGNVKASLVDSPVCQEAVKQNAANSPITGETGFIERVANLLSIITAVIAIIVIVVAGITMTLSGGDSTKVQNSRNAIIYAAVGLVIVALARTIVVFVVDRL